MIRKKFLGFVAFSILVLCFTATVGKAQNPAGDYYGYPYPPVTTTPYYPLPPQQYTPPMYQPYYTPPPLINPRQPLLPVVNQVANLVPNLLNAAYPNNLPYGMYPIHPTYQPTYGSYPVYPRYPTYPTIPYQQPTIGSQPGGTLICQPNGVCFNTVNQNGTGNIIQIPGGGPFIGNTVNQNGTGNIITAPAPPVQPQPIMPRPCYPGMICVPNCQYGPC